MRVKKVRPPLKMKDGVEVRTLEEFHENFDAEIFLKHFRDGTLLQWLETWCYADEAAKVREMDKDATDLKPLYDVFEIEYLGSSPEEIAWRTERLDRLKKYTADKKILAKVDDVAFDNEDLLDILEEGATNEIYLCGNEFNFPSGVFKFEKKSYHGVGNVTVKIESKTLPNFDALGIKFYNVKFDGRHKDKLNEPPKTNVTRNVDAEKIFIEANNYFYGRNGYAKNPGRARALYEEAARHGNIDAQNKLSFLRDIPLSSWEKIASQ